MRQTFKRLRTEAPGAWVTFLVGAATCSVLIALQSTISPTVAFGALVISGAVLGAIGVRIRDSVIAGFVMGYVAYAVGSASGVLVISLSGGYPPELVAAYTAIGIFVGITVGLVAGLWTAGAAAVGFIGRRGPHAAGLL